MARAINDPLSALIVTDEQIILGYTKEIVRLENEMKKYMRDTLERINWLKNERKFVFTPKLKVKGGK